MGYDNLDRDLTDEQKAAFVAEGRAPVLRLRMPDTDVVFDDAVRGEVRFPAGQIPDYVIVRGNGEPLYTLVNPVDDVLMGITHVLRGEDLLSSTPRQIAMYRALGEVGIGDGTVPVFGHLPYVMGEGNKKLSKRDPQSAIGYYREAGFIPEGLLNYLALLGWSLGRGPRHLHAGRDGRGLRHPPGQCQPCTLRPEEGRGDQRQPHPRARRRRLRRARAGAACSTTVCCPMRCPTCSEHSLPRQPHWCRSA